MWWPRFLRRNVDGRVTAELADALLIELNRLAVEHHHRDAREGIVLLADELIARLEEFAPELRDSAALLAIAALCPVCYERRLMRQHEADTDQHHSGYLHSRDY